MLKLYGEIFCRFLLLGCISFGGPVAHIGYFQHTFVQKLGWLSHDAYSKLIALSQILPGPGSSQIGFAIGLKKAGLWGGIAAFMGFTLPSFALMFFLAISINLNTPPSWLVTVSSSLKLLAAVIVLDAVITMFKHFCRNTLAILTMLLSAVLFFTFHSFYTQLIVLVTAIMIGITKQSSSIKAPHTQQLHTHIYWVPMLLFGTLFLISLGLQQHDSWAGLFATFYKNGSLVFGGGHVVLPLLQASIGDALTQEQFVFGYAAAQGVPGPMFTMATFMGAKWLDAAPFSGAVLATLAIFLPGLLLVLTINKRWKLLAQHPIFIGVTASINAAVVGFMIVALYNPILTSAVHSYLDLALVICGYIGLKRFNPPILLLIGIFVLLGFIQNSG